jgi:hypothetical protein
MIDWTKPIEWSDGSEASVIEIIDTDPPNYCVHVYLPAGGQRVNFPDMYRRNKDLTIIGVCYETGRIFDWNGADHTSTYRGYTFVRNR